MMHLRHVILLICITRNVLSDAEEEELKNEVHYKRATVDAELYSKQISFFGDSLIIGSNPADRIIHDRAPQNSQYRCKREPEAEVAQYNFHEISILKRFTNTFYVAVGESSEPKRAADYFVQIRREIWKCVDAKKPDESLKFYRIINELISINPIADIKFYDGIEVWTVNYLNNEWRAKIKEIRYMADYQDGNSYVALKYKGKLVLQHEDKTRNEIPNVIKNFKPRIEKYEEEYKELVFRTGDVVNRVAIDSEGIISLKIGASWTKDHSIEPLKDYICEKTFGMHPLPRRFQSQCYQQVAADSDHPETKKIYATISEPYLSRLFTLVRSEVWHCTSENGGLEFYRVVNEMIGTTPFKNVEYEDGIVALSSIRLSTPADGKSVRYTEIGHFYTHNGKRLDREVMYKLAHRQYPVSYLMISFSNPNRREIDLSFTLTQTSVYRTIIGTNGFDISVGSKVTDFIGKKQDSGRCTLEKEDNRKEDAFNTMFKVRIKNDDSSFYAWESISDFEQYYKLQASTVWLCTVTNALRFYRVINIIRVTAPVRIIEAFDGVDIVKAFDGKDFYLDITELKYISRSTKRAVMYVGEIGFFSREDSVIYEQNPYAMKWNEEETSHWLGVAAGDRDSYLPLRDFEASASNEIDQNLIISGEENANIMKFPLAQTKLGDNKDVVDCKLDDRSAKLFPDFQILDPQQSTRIIESMKDFEDSNTHSSYFEHFVYKLWLCDCPEKNYKFLRAVTKQSLKEEIPKKVGKIEYSQRDQVWIEMRSNGEHFIVKMKDIRYFNVNNPKEQPVTYDGYLSFEEPSPAGNWRSGTKPIPMEDIRKRRVSESQRLHYKLVQGKIGSYILPATAFVSQGSSKRGKRGSGSGSGTDDSGPPSPSPKVGNLVIGSGWETSIDSTETAACTRKGTHTEAPEDKPHYLPEISQVPPPPHTHRSSLFHNYFQLEQIQTWTCESNKAGQFLRVVSHFFTIPAQMDKLKKLIYYDGVTILQSLNSKPLQYEIIEVKYLDVEGKHVLKFSGKLKLNDADDDSRVIKPMSIPAAEEVFITGDRFYRLDRDEIYRTEVGPEGAIVEIGDRYISEISGRISCHENKNLKNIYEPRIVIVKKTTGGSFMKKLLSASDWKNDFHLTQRFWDCTVPDTASSGEWLYRIENKLRLKSDKMTLNVVYHYDGVIVNVEGAGKAYIEETKFFRRDGDQKGVRMIGLVSLHSSQQQTTTKTTTENEFRDFNYILDTQKVKFVWDDRPGDILEIGTELTDNINANSFDGQVVDCERLENVHQHYFQPWSTLINKVTLTDDGKKTKLIAIDSKEFFDSVEQELWKCKLNQRTVFYRLVNRFATSKKISAIYYHDGVTWKSRIFPDQIEILQFTEVKFLRNRGDVKFCNYDGELFLLKDDDIVVKRLFPMPITGDASDNSAAASQSTQPPKGVPLAFLMQYAFIKHKDMQRFTSNKVTDVVAHSQRKFQTTLVQSGHRVVQIGTAWEEESPNQNYNGEMRCTIDDMTPTNGLRYLPRVVEFIDDNAYLLSEEDILDMFVVKKIEVWLCTNDEARIIRIVSQLEGKVAIFAVRHTDAVTLDIVRLQLSTLNTVNVREIIYINSLNSKVVKYDGEISLLEKSQQVATRSSKSRSIREKIVRALSCAGPAGCQVKD